MKLTQSESRITKVKDELEEAQVQKQLIEESNKTLRMIIVGLSITIIICFIFLA